MQRIGSQRAHAAAIRKAREIYQALFSQPPSGTDARSLGAEWTTGVETLQGEVDGLTRQSQRYPFLSALEPFQELLRGMRGKPANWYITEAPKREDDLLNAKEDILDKVKSFMAGAQKGIYHDAWDMLSNQAANIDYVDPETGQKIRAALEDPDCFLGPTIQKLKTDLFDLRNRVDLKMIEERKAVSAAVEDVAAKIVQMPDFQVLDAEKQARITSRIDSHKADLDVVTLIPVLRDRANGARTTLLADVIAELDRLARPAPSPMAQPGMSDSPAPAPQPPATVLASQLKVIAPKTLLADEADVDGYLEEFRKTLLAEIRAGRKVIV